MKRLLCVTISLLCVMGAGLAYAQGGWVQLTADAGALSCHFSAAETITVYQIHQSSPGTTLSRYKIDDSNANTVVWLADNYSPWLIIGQANTGITVGYGACMASPVVIGFSLYNYASASGGTACDGYLRVVPDPAASGGTILSVDCTLPIPGSHPAGGSIATLGVLPCSPACGDDVPPPPPPVAVRDTSWGRIKSLYN